MNFLFSTSMCSRIFVAPPPYILRLSLATGSLISILQNSVLKQACLPPKASANFPLIFTTKLHMGSFCLLLFFIFIYSLTNCNIFLAHHRTKMAFFNLPMSSYLPTFSTQPLCSIFLSNYSV